MDKKRKQISESLLQQLAIQGAAIECFEDLISDYMDFWDTKNALIQDIKNRGVTFRDLSSTGIEMHKNNPSVKELVSVNKQMLSILKELHLETDKVGMTDDEKL
jgi:hypothetical protein